MPNVFLESAIISFSISLIISIISWVVSVFMSSKEQKKSTYHKIQNLISPRFTMFLIPTVVILAMFLMTHLDDLVESAQYSGWLALIGFVSFLPLIQIKKYKPKQKLKKFGPHNFIKDHFVMKYALFASVTVLVLFAILFELEEILKISEEWSNFLLYVLIYLLLMAFPANRLFNYSITLESSFIFSKAYCTLFKQSTIKDKSIELLNKTLRKYNAYLEQKYGFFINNRLDIIQKYIIDESTYNTLNLELFDTFDFDNQNKPMEYIFKKFIPEKTILNDNNILEKFKNNASILSVLISILVGAATVLSIALSFTDNGNQLI